jgi:hypothetical protein
MNEIQQNKMQIVRRRYFRKHEYGPLVKFVNTMLLIVVPKT